MQSGGKIAFGKRGDVSIYESTYQANTNLPKGKLEFYGKGGFYFNAGFSVEKGGKLTIKTKK